MSNVIVNTLAIVELPYLVRVWNHPISVKIQQVAFDALNKLISLIAGTICLVVSLGASTICLPLISIGILAIALSKILAVWIGAIAGQVGCTSVMKRCYVYVLDNPNPSIRDSFARTGYQTTYQCLEKYRPKASVKIYKGIL